MAGANDSVHPLAVLRPLPPHRRLAAWLVTGPVGFLVAGVVDWVALLARYLWARARGREPWE